jgi:hypothetical protein
MNFIKNFLATILLTSASLVFARGGDDVGNGGFAYKQSVNILKMAAAALEEKIKITTVKDIVEHSERRIILQDTLDYEDLEKLSKKNQYRGGRKLAMNYIVNPPTVIILKPYFEAFAGKTDTELEDASLEVQKRLLHEASHIWGYNEVDSEAFARRFLDNVKVGVKRPTHQIDIQPNFCSCLNGKSDLINDCDNFCRQKPNLSTPILYLNTNLGPEILQNPKLGNLYNWCNAQLENDVTTPQCFLSATDGVNTISDIFVTVDPYSNSITANIQQLTQGEAYVFKIIEGKTGSNAESNKSLIKRRLRRTPSDSLGALKIMPINQYTCLLFGGKVDTNGNVIRDGYIRRYYYFAGNEIPSPMPPTKTGMSQIVCHDEQVHPGNDSVMYPRLELVFQYFTGWDKSDTRFNILPEHYGKLTINKILEQRLFDEYNISRTIDIFKLIHYPNGPIASPEPNVPLSYIMLPFTNQNTGRSFCPTFGENNMVDPLFQILSEYMGNSEGLYIAEKEPEIVGDGSYQNTIYGTMFVNETILKNYGFTIEHGIKTRVNEETHHTHTIFYYWPINDNQDPLVQGNSKLFTVKYPDQLNGDVPMGIPSTLRTSDKRIGCIPKRIL